MRRPAATAGRRSTTARTAHRARYRARPRLRRLRSAADNFRGFGLDFDPRDADPGAPSTPAPAARARIGARRRASRQMKSEIPPSTSTAPAAIAIAAPPERELDPVVPVVEIVGTAVVVVGVGPEGSDGENGLLPVFAPGTTADPADPADPVDPADPADPADPVEPEAATATIGAAKVKTNAGTSAPTSTAADLSRRSMRRETTARTRAAAPSPASPARSCTGPRSPDALRGRRSRR